MKPTIRQELDQLLDLHPSFAPHLLRALDDNRLQGTVWLAANGSGHPVGCVYGLLSDLTRDDEDLRHQVHTYRAQSLSAYPLYVYGPTNLETYVLPVGRWRLRGWWRSRQLRLVLTEAMARQAWQREAAAVVDRLLEEVEADTVRTEGL